MTEIGAGTGLDEKVAAIWESLGRTGDRYVLIGGTALAYRLRHRVSYDIDLCTSGPAEHPNALKKRWGDPRIGKHKWIRRQPDHYIKFFGTSGAPKIEVHGKVKGGCLEEPETAESGLRIASLTDILKQKLVAMCHREQTRDAHDVAAILDSNLLDLPRKPVALRTRTIPAPEFPPLRSNLPTHGGRFHGLSAIGRNPE